MRFRGPYSRQVAERVVRAWGTGSERRHREQRLPCIGEPPVTVPRGKRGTGDTRRFVWDWLDRHRAMHDKPPHLAVRPSLTPINRTNTWRTSLAAVLHGYTSSAGVCRGIRTRPIHQNKAALSGPQAGYEPPAERCPPEEVHDGLPVTPLLQIREEVQELVSSRPPQLNKLNQQGMTCGHTQPYNAQAIVSLRLAQQETTVVTESDGVWRCGRSAAPHASLQAILTALSTSSGTSVGAWPLRTLTSTSETAPRALAAPSSLSKGRGGSHRPLSHPAAHPRSSVYCGRQ